MRTSRSSSRSSKEPKKTNKLNIPLGSEYDLTIDMNEDFILTAGKVHALDLNVSDRKSYALATSRSKSSRSTTSKATSGRNSKTHQLDLTDTILEGVNDPTVHRVGAVTSRNIPSIQAPVKLSRFDSSLKVGEMKQAPKTARPAHPDFPNGHVQTYIFGFDNPHPYIPHPFVSSHKPKAPRPKTTQSRRIQEVPEFKLTSKQRLSARRDVQLKSSKLTNSIVFGNLDSLIVDAENA